MHKYQFCIFEYNDATNNSAATKAVSDCNKIFKRNGYTDYTLTFHNNSKRGWRFYLAAFKGIAKLLLQIEKGALVGIQYPMLNNVFKYFIKAARIKDIKFFCIIHDVESLRLGAKDPGLIKKETANLSYYDFLIVHNPVMLQWLKNNGVTTRMLPLGIFDYLADKPPVHAAHSPQLNTIVYAGNLSKSKFIYKLDAVKEYRFNVYGPNLLTDEKQPENTKWCGVFSPDEIVYRLDGDFGLIWDGEDINELDSVLGNYLLYNNPHKASLYLAAGLPVIAPKNSAIGKLLDELKVGVLIDTLADLNTLKISPEEYQVLKSNCLVLQSKIINGDFFTQALAGVESQLLQ
ncbi:hypothetical protein KHS38_00420 [Mucilaginibacter sp. Bleaf8]|uniref:hypothetical protein n=1 Tax=Mucilaginibacter sp. Bleaf8 TaxID=2834430 RepID=UPI001BCC9CB1|nr:hypothetical protein [Mucilaginibacter sp. Bleaf8]MBS7562854.1 hypothetical protein [Mucilaginibacter sp. Bleaf8]